MRINLKLLLQTGACCVALAGCESRPPAGQAISEALTAQVLGQTYLDENRFAEAEAEFAKLVRLAPDQPTGYANLGLVYLQQGRYDRAEEQVRQALRIAPEDPDILLILATTHQLAGRANQARDLLEQMVRRPPADLRASYALATLYLTRGDDPSRRRAEGLLEQLVEAAPANIVARLDLVDLLLRHRQPDRATLHLEEVQRQVPEIPREAQRFFDRALLLMRRSDAEGALAPLERFRNFLSGTPFYQTKIRDLWGPAGEQAGVPTVTLSPVSVRLGDPRAVLAGLRFTDVTADVGLTAIPAAVASAALAVGDYDGDGDLDLFTGRGGTGALFTGEAGRFVGRQERSLGDVGAPLSAAFADYDNDGHLDLYVAGARSGALLANLGDGRFRDTAQTAGLRDSLSARRALFLDADHDGDLDLYLATSSGNRLYRNNLDGTFTERSALMGLAGGGSGSRDAAFGDFDDDGDVDLFVVNDDASNALYANLREGRYQDIAGASGVSNEGGSGAVTAGDYDNDGFLDLFVTGLAGGRYALYHNRGDGTFEREARSRTLFQALDGVVGWDATFFDFDNDGFLDLLVVGEASAPGGRGLFLFHNDGTGRFEDRSSLLPPDILSGRRTVVADYGDDGDLDIFLATGDGSVRLLRNDGADANPYLDLRLRGLRTGSGKNNYFGIGAKIELRSGDRYQMRVVTGPVTHFGLGERLKADVVRIRWTNGVYQDLFYPGSDQDLVERPLLKGSCAFLYVWDGTQYRFVTDLMWRSALGMPLGIMAAGGGYGPPGASQEYLRIPGETLQPKDGAYSLQITEELWETAYLDEVKLVAVDHPDSVEIHVDERFVPPAPASLRVYQITRRRPPVSAVDDQGTDLLPMIREKDDRYAAMLRAGRYQGTTQMHDVILDLGEVSGAESTLLLLNGWVFPTDASINVAISQSKHFTTVPPLLQVPDGDGRWQTVLPDLSFPAGKSKTVVADLTGKLRSGDHRVRIRTNMEVYWDQILVAAGGPAGRLRLTTLEPVSANLHYRGFSRTYRKGGRYGPHWFDYDAVSRESPWGPITGGFTRYGQVLPLLRQSDDMYVIMGPGDEATVTFDARGAPELPPGWRRDFLIYTDGWIKDADLNTATGDRVGPLPFHAMSRYPYGSQESYPTDQAHRRYLTDFNTRNVGSRGR